MKNGFVFNVGQKMIFIETSAKNKTDKLAYQIIDIIWEIRPFLSADTIERAKKDKPTLADIKRRTDRATLEKRVLQNGIIFYTIKGKNFTCSMPEKDFTNDVIMKGM